MKGKVLFILPCNRGAKEGNYFKYGGWKQTLASLEKYTIPLELVDFAAVDSIITIKDPEGDKNTKGAIVTEFEMDRVKGYDIKPRWERFRKNEYKLLYEHTKACEIGLGRLIPRYELALIVLNVRGYKYATIRALRNLDDTDTIPSNVIVIDCGESPSFLNNGIYEATQILDDYTKRKKLPLGKIIRPSKLGSNSPFLHRPESIPKPFRYWESGYYIKK